MRKNVLITGLNGFVGNELQSLLEENGCNVFRISLKNNDWKLQSLSKFDVVINLAALVHNNTPNAKMVDYMNINYHLTKQFAEKAKNDGVPQFIFLSTMTVNKPGLIDLGFRSYQNIRFELEHNKHVDHIISKDIKTEYNRVMYAENIFE